MPTMLAAHVPMVAANGKAADRDLASLTNVFRLLPLASGGTIVSNKLSMKENRGASTTTPPSRAAIAWGATGVLRVRARRKIRASGAKAGECRGRPGARAAAPRPLTRAKEARGAIARPENT